MRKISPLDTNVYVDTRIQWAPQKLASFALDSLIVENVKEAINLILLTLGSGSYSSLRGDLFENLAHIIVSAGGDFMVRDLKTGSISQESFKSYPTCHFKEIRDQRSSRVEFCRHRLFSTTG